MKRLSRRLGFSGKQKKRLRVKYPDEQTPETNKKSKKASRKKDKKRLSLTSSSNQSASNGKKNKIVEEDRGNSGSPTEVSVSSQYFSFESTSFADDMSANHVNEKVGKEDFELLKVIGRGSFGKVMLVRHLQTQKVFAMKVMRKDAIIAKNQVTHTNDEKHILQKIAHPFIVHLAYAFQTKDKLYMIMDYINGGELFFHLKHESRFPEERTMFYGAEIASALMHLHANGIIYRDLKPENILLDKFGHIVITDFGLSKEVQDEKTNTFCGTPEYLAPEVLSGDFHTFPVDWWSLGILIYEMMTGLPPFFSNSVNVMYQKILNGTLRFPESMSSEARDLLSRLLDRNPDTRLSAEGIKSHPFFSSIDWRQLEAKEIDPPWVPPVTVEDDTDITQIDLCFTTEEVKDSLVSRPAWLEISEEDEDLFVGFTFNGGEIVGDAYSSSEEDL
eukprot:TRINITY_DN11274_c0_g1_i1.p1 TRINITY_DN11274_c0_g1~~TRINITY_DN11274_c0_g1_i1.p1  ORF type:complete len:445 (-),score=109.91 TRINITY_DN11274_c0_g1_i1:51-1385(-)